MIFCIDGQEYDVNFRYEIIPSRYLKNRTKKDSRPKMLRKTFCTISLIDAYEVGRDKYKLISIGQAVQHPNDQDCKVRGRKLALRKAIDGFMDKVVFYDRGTENYKKKIRAKIWEAYFYYCDLKILPVNKKEIRERREQQKALKYAYKE